MTAGEEHGQTQAARGVYAGYLIVTSALIYVVGFITAALGVLVMLLALAGLATYAFATSGSGRADSLAGTAATELFRWREVGVVVLACLPALFVPSELTSPMASVVFFTLFAVPSYVVVLAWRAWSRWQRQREALAPVPPELGATSPPPGWYADPADLRLVRWWDGWRWTPYAQPRPWSSRGVLEAPWGRSSTGRSGTL